MPTSSRSADLCLDIPLAPEDFAAVALLGARLADEGGARPPGALGRDRFRAVTRFAPARPEVALHQVSLGALLALKTI